MSHITVCEIEIRSLEALRRAAQDCGLEFRENQRTHRWYGHWMGAGPMPEGHGTCEHALSVAGKPDAYEVGIVRSGDGWELRFDMWNGGFGLESAVGPNCQKLLQRYGCWAARLAAEADGMEVSEETLADGTIKLTCSTPQFETQGVGGW